MLNQTFSAKTLRRYVEPQDLRRFQISGGSSEIRQITEHTANQISSGQFLFQHLSKKPTKKSAIFSSTHLGENLVLRKLNDNIRRVYKLRQSDRDEITTQIQVLLRETSPKHVIRSDIKSFYESISRDNLHESILKDTVISNQTKTILSTLFAHEQIRDWKGLPRGFAISSTLAEMYVKNLDYSIRRTPEIYFYARFVDDFVAFAFDRPGEVFEQIERAFNENGLNLSTEKTEFLSINQCTCTESCACPPDKTNCECEPANSCNCRSRFQKYHKDLNYPKKHDTGKKIAFRYLDYLGYRFYTSPVNLDDKNGNPVYTSISENKVKKIKSRIGLSLLAYSKDSDFSLLRDRLKFLTGSFPIRAKQRRLLAGIPHSYTGLALSVASSPDQYDPLSDLDAFLRRAFFSQKSRIGSHLRKTTTLATRRSLARLSFKGSYQSRIIHNFPEQRLTEIKKAWLYEQN